MNAYQAQRIRFGILAARHMLERGRLTPGQVEDLEGMEMVGWRRGDAGTKKAYKRESERAESASGYDASLILEPTEVPILRLGPNVVKITRQSDGWLHVWHRRSGVVFQAGPHGTITGISISTGEPFYIATYGLILAAAKRQGIPVRRDWVELFYGPDHEPTAARIWRKLREQRA